MKVFRFKIGSKTKSRIRFVIKSLILPLLATALMLTFLYSSSLINLNVVAYSSAFSILFILTIFPLKGKFLNKILTLTLGNFLSLLWNGLYPIFLSWVFSESILLNRLFSFINPIFNALWIISVWGLGLSMTSPSKVYMERRT